MDMITNPDLFLLWKICISGRITHCQQTDELIAFGGIHYLLYLLGFISYGDMKHRAKSLVGGGKEHVFKSTPCRCKIIERALFHRVKQSTLFLFVERYY